MTTFEEAKDALRIAHTEQGFRLIDEHKRELYFAIGQTDQPRLFVSEEEIDEYRKISDEVATLRAAPVETSVVGSTFREQLVQILAPLRLPVLLFRDREIKFVNEAGMTVRVGLPSPIFVNLFSLAQGTIGFSARAT
jgi:hypothetical protein